MKILRVVRRILKNEIKAWKRLFSPKTGLPYERLAKIKACRLSRDFLNIKAVLPAEGGCFVEIEVPEWIAIYGKAYVWADRTIGPTERFIATGFVPKANENLIWVYGRHELHCKPTAYLEVFKNPAIEL